MHIDPHTPVSAEARGRLRVLWAELEAEAAQIEAAVSRVPATLARDALKKFGKGADAAVQKVIQHIPVPPLYFERRIALWRFLRPGREAGRLSIRVEAVALNGATKPGLTIKPFGFAATNHSLARLLDRSQFQGDPVRAILQAHSALLRLTPEDGERLYGLGSFILPAEQGGFLVAPNGSDGGDLMSVAQTWVGDDQLWRDQQRDLEAWKTLTQMPPAA